MKKRKISWVAAAVCFLLLLFGVTVSMLAAFRSSGRLVSERTTGEKLRMAIDAGVDGIILNGDGSPEVEALVKEARQKGIPVVTALNDGAEDIRQCFVGVNSYNLGKE